MNKLFVILVVLLVVAGFWKVNKYLSDQLYEQCISAGKQSQETCEFETYYR